MPETVASLFVATPIQSESTGRTVWFQTADNMLQAHTETQQRRCLSTAAKQASRFSQAVECHRDFPTQGKLTFDWDLSGERQGPRRGIKDG